MLKELRQVRKLQSTTRKNEGYGEPERTRTKETNSGSTSEAHPNS